MHADNFRTALSWRRRIFGGAMVAILVSAAPVVAQRRDASGLGARALTVERIWGQPSLSGSTTAVQWSPDGKWLSYTERRGQGREARPEIWVLDVTSGERRVLVDGEKMAAMQAPPREASMTAGQATGLGRLAAQRYFWAPNGSGLLVVTQGTLFWFDLKAQTSKRLTQGDKAVGDPKISPDNRSVSFLREHDLWVVDLATGREKRLTTGGTEEMMNGELDWVYPEELGINTAYWWSPDSQRIAYLQMDQRQVTRYPLVNFLEPVGTTTMMRYPKAGDANPVVRVGVVALKDAKIRWMDTGTEKDVYIPRVEWLRDSKRLAIQRLNRAQTKLELLFSEVSSGRSQMILTEVDPYWINVHDELYFFADGKKFLWASERDGYRHLYLYDMKGKLERQVTSGNWEVTAVSGIDEGAGTVYFTGTEKTPLERHLYRVSLRGGVATRITRDDGSYSINMAPTAKHFVASYSNSMTPPRQDLYQASGGRVTVINENRVAELAEYNLQLVEFFTVRGADGTPLNAMMVKPPGFNASRKYPVLIYTYGGPHAQIVRNQWGGANFLWHQLMAQKGYIIFGLDNRGSAGRGHAFESSVHKKFGQNELADQLAGVNYLKSQSYVDGDRIGIWGWSYGGYMTCFAMLNAADVFRAGFAGAPVTDWRNYDTIYTERYMQRPQENPEGYKNASPVNQAAQLKGRLLVSHGTGDDNVHFANSVQLMEEFIRAGKYAEFLTYPLRGHGISDSRARIHLFNRVTEFFLDNL